MAIPLLGRTAHVKRVYGTNSDGSPDFNTWVDVLRIDAIYPMNRHALSPINNNGQYHTFAWNDRNGEDGTQNQHRITKPLILYDPTDPAYQDNPPKKGDEGTVTLYLVKQISTSRYGDPNGINGWGCLRTFNNDASARSSVNRKVTVIRVKNDDFGGSDNDPFGGDNPDPNKIVDWNDYFQALSNDDVNIDDTQYIDIELVKQYYTNTYGDLTPGSNGAPQGNTYALDNSYLIKLYDPPDKDASIPPFRLDPLQMVVNVSWGAGGIFVVSTQTSPAPSSIDINLFSLAMPNTKSDSTNWRRNFVLSTGNTCSLRGGAFGSITDDQGNKKGIFVAGGIEATLVQGDEDINSLLNGVILTSSDGGQSWDRTYSDQGYIYAMVFDETSNTFFAMGSDLKGTSNVADTIPPANYITLASGDGSSWDMVDSIPAAAVPTPSSYASVTMLGACNPVYTDGNGNPAPGSVYGYDKKKGIIMAPYPRIDAYDTEARSAGSQIEILSDNLTNFTPPVTGVTDAPGLSVVFSVAYAAGVWMVTGSPTDDELSTAVIVSIDDGQTWNQAYTTEGTPAVILAGQRSDFDPQTWQDASQAGS